MHIVNNGYRKLKKKIYMILRIAIVTVIGISSITFNVFTTDIKSITLNFNVNELSDETIASNNVYYIKKVYFCSVKC